MRKDRAAPAPATAHEAAQTAGDPYRTAPSITTVQRSLREQTPIVQRLLERAVPDDMRGYTTEQWQRLKLTMARLRGYAARADPAVLARVQAEIAEIRYEVSMRRDAGRDAATPGLAARNWKVADAQVRAWVVADEPITIERIREINRMLEAGLAPGRGIAGELRTQDIEVPGDTKRVHVAYEDVPAQLVAFIDWYRANEYVTPPIELAARSYQWLETVHPFHDANGPTSRLVVDWIARRHWLPTPAFTQHHLDVAVFASDADPDAHGMGPTRATIMVTVAIQRAAALLEAALAPPGPP